MSLISSWLYSQPEYHVPIYRRLLECYNSFTEEQQDKNQIVQALRECGIEIRLIEHIHYSYDENINGEKSKDRTIQLKYGNEIMNLFVRGDRDSENHLWKTVGFKIRLFLRDLIHLNLIFKQGKVENNYN